MRVQVAVILTRAKGSILLWYKEEGRSLGGFRGDNSSGFQVFFNEGFTCLHLRWIERIDFGDLWNEVGAKFNGVVIGAMRGKLIMGFLGENISKVRTPVRYGRFNYPSCLGYLGGDGSFVDQFPV